MQCTRRFQPSLRILGRAYDHHSVHHKVPDFTKKLVKSSTYTHEATIIPADLARHLMEIQHSINNLSVRLTMYEQNLHRLSSRETPEHKD